MLQYLNFIRILFALFGLILHFIAHRYLSSYGFYHAVVACGFFFQLIALALSLQVRKFSTFSDSKTDKNNIFRKIIGWQLLLIFSSLLFILAQSKFAVSALSWQKNVLFVSWMFPLVLGLFWSVGVEFALRRNSSGIVIDGLPIQLSSINWFSLGLLFSGLVALNYVALKTDKTIDLSYFKTTKPGPATVSVAENLESPVEIVGFFSRGSDVSHFVRQYLDLLAKQSPQINVKIVDKDFSPELAEKFRASMNGQIVMLSDGKRQRVEVGDSLESGRRILRKLDELILSDLLSISSPKKVFYLMQGHGEMSWIKSDTNPRRSLKNFQKLLRSFNYIPKHLSLTTGKNVNVPSDASILAVVGPSIDFSQNELEALKDFINSGGSLLILFDVEFAGANQQMVSDSNARLEGWLASLGISFKQQLLVNDQKFLRFTRQKIDRAFLGTNNISAHASVASLSKNDRKTGLVVLESGHLEISDVNPSWKHVPTIRSLGSTFVDLNRNLEKDPNEKRSNYILAVASEHKEAKIVSFADSTLISDPVISNPGNQLAVLDAIKWLADEKNLEVATSSEEDIKIQHSKIRDLFVFHGAIYILPAFVLLIGFVATRRRKGI